MQKCEALRGSGKRQRGGEQATRCSAFMRVEDYLFRFDRGAFNMASASEWMTRRSDFTHPTKLPLYVATSNNPISRSLFRWFFTTSNLYAALHLAPPEAIASQLILQDLFTPAAQAAACVRHARDVTRSHAPADACPIWTWPVRGSDSLLAPNGWHGRRVSSGAREHLFINCGVYTRCADGAAAEVTSALEEWLVAAGGRKLLYSNNYFTSTGREGGEGGGGEGEGAHEDNENEGDLWAAGYDRVQYDALREATGAEGRLPRIEDKVLSKTRRAAASNAYAWQVAFAKYLL